MGAEAESHWIKNDAARKAFWATVNALCNTAGIPPGSRKSLVHLALGVDHVEMFAGDQTLALQHVSAYLKTFFAVKFRDAYDWEEQAIAEEMMETWLANDNPGVADNGANRAEQSGEVPSQNTAESLQNERQEGSGGKPDATLPNDKSASQNAPTLAQLYEQIAALQAENETLKAAQSHNEPPEVVFTTVIANGVELHMTAKTGSTPESVANVAMTLLRAVGALYTHKSITSFVPVIELRNGTLPLKDKPFDVKNIVLMPDPYRRDGGRTGASGPGATGSSSPDSGEAACIKIEVGKSFTGGKPQLKFDCEGFERPLTFTRENLVAILAGATHKGRPFTAEMLKEGAKFGGEWLVKWEKQEGKDGKTHLNVISVSDSSAE